MTRTRDTQHTQGASKHRLPRLRRDLAAVSLLVMMGGCREQDTWLIRGEQGTATTDGGSAGASVEPETGGTIGTGGETAGGSGGTGGVVPEATGGVSAAPGETGGTGGASEATGGTSAETGGTAAETGGQSGTGGEVTYTPVPVDGLIGFAENATGGGNAPPEIVTTCAALQAALQDDVLDRVIQIPEGTVLACQAEETSAQIVCEKPCLDGSGTPTGKTTYVIPNDDVPCETLGLIQTTLERNELRVAVASHKTLVGLGSGATLQNTWLNLKDSSNIIIRNLVIEDVNPEIIEEAGDGVTLEDSRDIWIDHCRFRSISDGFIDALRATATISWNHFVGANEYSCGGKHLYTMDVNDESQITLHHNRFDNTGGSNPALDNATTFAHVFNNYWERNDFWDGTKGGCISVGALAQVLLEGNYFLDSVNPHSVSGDAQIEAVSNEYVGTTGNQVSNATGFSSLVRYVYSVDPASEVPEIVATSAGPMDGLAL